jgi:conjugal transfer mating pair stabilization protein TraG
MAVLGVMVLGLVIVGARTVYTEVVATYFSHPDYTPLLNTIARGESRGNYNAYFGHTANVTIRFTDMSVADVMQWQQDYVKKGSPSSAVGKYQIIRPTLAGLVKKLDIDPETKFDEKLQDRMAVALLEKRGAKDFMRHKLTREEFAANLAQEWAALPKVTGTNPGQSYYAGDGINKVQVSTDEMYSALASIKPVGQ